VTGTNKAGGPGACIIKLFTAVIYGFPRNPYIRARVFVPGKPLQRAKHLSGAPL
jgi:hypothetical protein